MIEASVHGQLLDGTGWKKLEGQLRPFIASRLPTHDAVDDVLQEVLLKIQSGLPELRDEDRFGPWVYRVTRNAIVDFRRASSRRRMVEDAGDRQAAPSDVPSENEREREFAGACALLFVSALPSPYREALTLTEIDGMTQAAAARELGLSVSGMKSRVQRGRKKLRQALENCCSVALDGRRRVIGFEPKEHGIDPTRDG